MMIKNILRLFLILFMSSSYASETCNPRHQKGDIYFNFNIQNSFHTSFNFSICQEEENKNYILLKETEYNTKAVTIKKIGITDKQVNILFELLRQSYTFNAFDNVFGTDGSKWCVETTYYATYTKACFFDPSYKTKERGLFHFYALGLVLHDITR